MIDVDVLSRYIPKEEPNLLPAKLADASDSYENPGERAAIIRMLYNLKQEVEYLKEVVASFGVQPMTPPQGYIPSEIHNEID